MNIEKRAMNQLAAHELNEVLILNPQDSEAWLNLGELYLSAQVYLKAKQAFSKVLEISAENEKAKWLLFYVARLEKDDFAAQKYLGQIVETSENKTKLLFERALLAKRLNQQSEYSRWIQAAYETDPHSRKVCLEFVNEFIGKSDYDSAFVILNHYAQTHDFDLEISEALAEMAIRTNQFEIAVAELERQKDFKKSSIDVNLKLAHLYFLEGKLQIAEQFYQDVLQEDPSQDQAYFYLGQIYANQDLNDLAKPAFRQIKASSAYFAEAQVWLAKEELKSGEMQNAIQRH